MSVWRGKVAIITGGASGIGAAFARALAAAGADVVVADRQLELAEELAAEIKGHALELDVRDFGAMKRVVDETVARAGRVDLFFNNAGIAAGGEMDVYTLADWDDLIDVNLKGVAYGVQAVYPVMIKQRSGHIINTASMAGLVTSIAQGAYTTTKHAVVGLSKALRVEARHHNVRVSVLCPGVIRTPILSGGRYGHMNLGNGLSADQLTAVWERLWPMDVDVFARKALRAIAADRAIIVFPRWWKLAWYMERLSPWLMMKLAEVGARKFRRELAGISAQKRS
jgi:NAD(P)-dependent dehydrogenase (short-subunit alcohol dehydrogenase family)